MRKIYKIFISIFILFNFLIMLRIYLPLNTVFFSSLYKPIDRYLSFFSTYQDWMMFAANPSRTSTFLTAKIEFMDGSVDNYHFPRPADLSLKEKYIYGERFRKIMSEALSRNDHKYLWKDAAKFVIRKVKEKNFNKIPIKVHLNRHWTTTPRMEERFILHRSRTENYQSLNFYTYEVL